MADREILLKNGAWLNSAIINAAQLLLQEQCKGDVKGWQSTLLSDSADLFKPIQPNRKFIQILYLKSHWIVTSNIDVSRESYYKDVVCIYDSLRPSRIPFSVKKDICSFLKFCCTGDVLHFDIMNIEGQPNSSDCGIYAIACATELINGYDPVAVKWNTTRLREHLLSCLDNNAMTRFPNEGQRRGFGPQRRIIKRIKEQIYCTCRMVNDKTREMIKCCNCLKWYHLDCMNITDEHSLKDVKWTCCVCIEYVEKLKESMY